MTTSDEAKITHDGDERRSTVMAGHDDEEADDLKLVLKGKC